MEIRYTFNKEIYQDYANYIELENEEDYERLKNLDSIYEQKSLIDKLVNEGRAEITRTDELKSRGPFGVEPIDVDFLD
jgi:hypothetical protein